MSGLFVAKDCSYTLLDVQELDKFVGLPVPVVTQKQRLMIGVTWELVRWHLEGMFGRIEERVSDLVKTIRVCVCANSTGNLADGKQVMNAVDVKHTGEQQVTVEWESSGENDMIADATVGLLAGVDKSAASVKYCSRDGVTSHAHVHADACVGPWQQKMAWFLEAHFGAVGHSEPGHDPVLVVRVDGEEARVDLMSSVSDLDSWGWCCADGDRWCAARARCLGGASRRSSGWPS